MTLVEQVTAFCRNENIGITDISFTTYRDDDVRFVLSKVKASENIIVLYIYPFYMGISTDNFIMDNLENNGENHFITFCGYYYKPNERLYVCEGEYLGRYVCMENPHYPYKVSAVFDKMRKDVTEAIYNRLRKEIPAVSVELPSETDQNCLACRVFFSEKEPTLSVKKVMSYFLECCNMDNLERWLANPTKWENDEAERLLSNHKVADTLRQIVLENTVAIAQANLVRKEPGHLWNIINEIYLVTKDKKTVMVTVNSKKFKGTFRYDTRGFHTFYSACSDGWVMDVEARKALNGSFDVRDITTISYKGKDIFVAKGGIC